VVTCLGVEVILGIPLPLGNENAAWRMLSVFKRSGYRPHPMAWVSMAIPSRLESVNKYRRVADVLTRKYIPDHFLNLIGRVYIRQLNFWVH